MTRMTTALLASTAIVAGASASSAAPLLGLVGDNTLVMIDSDAATITGEVQVTGADRLLGLDLRPGTGQIIGVTADHVLVEIDPDTGAATEIATMDVKLPLVDGQPVVVDFNPMADKLRFMTGVTNHRVDADTGAVTVDGSLAFEGADMHAGETPNIVAAAYSNAFGKPEATAMYDIDATIVALIRQTKPNDGTLAAIGKLGIESSETYAFDIATDAAGVNTGWLATGATLHEVSLETGAAGEGREITGVTGPLRDITALAAQ
jgi:hypothetical protein